MIPTKLTGEEIEELKQQSAAHFWPHARQAGNMSDETGVKVVTKGKGVWVEDVEGKRWFDVISGLWLKNIGHGRTEIAEAVYEQMQNISFSPGGTVSPITIKVAARIASLAPDKDSRIYFVSGGAEANETALKMAKNYHFNNGQASRWKVISRRGSYHGATYACMGLGGGGINAPTNFGPLMPGNIHVNQPNQYRCLYCSDRGGCNLECARDVDRAIVAEGPSTVAAFIGEPISAAAGIYVPHHEYWPTIQDICNRHGVLLICDEVITGFGRTGKMFATENWGVKPDIFTVAKALTGGYLPIGAAIAAKHISDAFIGEDATTFAHLITFGGNPPVCAAADTTLDIMQRENIVENSAQMGDYLFEKLQSLYEHRIVGDVRGGMGLLAALELVQDRDTRKSFPKESQLAPKVNALMNQHGLLGRGGDIISLAPPLNVTSDEIDYLVDQIDQILTELETQL